MLVVGSPEMEADEARQTLREFFAEIEVAGGTTLSAGEHKAMTRDIRADRGTLSNSGEG
jgi:hypothetical protein